ncbi:MAG: tRNA (guanosine(46)-N7)-methyltransferase TrmB [Firmicutes bacterium]|nr:tRNA (guanosine(46)-N7)-methyltransferase TrmB [Bacillota bacterium]
MRLKNVRGAKEIINASQYIVEDPFVYLGKYQQLFNNNNPIEIEIGMGKGDFIIGKALKNPNINYIGIEKFDSVIVRAIQKLESLDLKNLKLIRMDALDIDKVFNKEIDTLYLNFSDPWPKNRHEMRRLTSKIFLKKYENLFKDKPCIIQKTDNRKLFEFSIISYVENGYKIDEISLDLYKDDTKDNIATEYEKRFVSLGQTIFMVKVSRH